MHRAGGDRAKEFKQRCDGLEISGVFPALEELLVVAANHLKSDDVKPFVGHPRLKAATTGLGSIRKNQQVKKLLGL